MTLEEYLKLQGMTADAFARLIGVSRYTVNRYISGQRRPNYRVLSRIVRATGGKVTADSFFPQEKLVA
jgi:transcriptional regulator with XRE-family HTH domain